LELGTLLALVESETLTDWGAKAATMKTFFTILALSALVASAEAGVITNQETEVPYNCMTFAHSVDLSSDGNVLFPNNFGRCNYSEEEQGRETQIQLPQTSPDTDS